jgi:hypothetical protein
MGLWQRSCRRTHGGFARQRSSNEIDKAMHPLTLVLILILLVTWARLFRPVRKVDQGTTTTVVALPLLAKIRMHSIPSLIAIAFAVGLVVSGNLPWWGIAAPVISTILLLSIPVNYTITDVGLRLGWTEFRRWTEFAGVRRTRFGASLVGISGGRSMAIWLSGGRDDDQFIHFLRQTIKNAYKGHGASAPVNTEGSVATAMVHDLPQPHIATFSRTDQILSTLARTRKAAPVGAAFSESFRA